MNDKSFRCVVSSGLVAVFLAACGGTDGGGTPSSNLAAEQCPAVPAPCGGDLVGDWDIVDICSTAAPTNPDGDCPDATLTVLSIDLEGSQSFLADGTTTSSEGTAEYAMRYDTPTSCLARPCSELASALRRNLETGYEVLDVECKEQGKSCVCPLQLRETLPATQQTYEVNGSRVTTTDADGEMVEDYCVEGNRATFVSGELTVVLERR